jgi:hypothetical protein
VKIEGFIEADTGSPIPTDTNYKLLEIERRHQWQQVDISPRNREASRIIRKVML